MAQIGQGIAFAALVAAAVTLELYDKNADGLWFLMAAVCFLASVVKMAEPSSV